MSWRLKLLYRGARIYWRIFRPLTMGVKLMLIDADRQIVLVRHSYQPGWFMPGGGIKRGETIEMAARREAKEELDAQLGALHLFGVYSNISVHQNDHVMVMRCHDFEIGRPNDREIVEIRRFALDQLPLDASKGVRHRVLEYQQSASGSYIANW